jgi:CRP-like cAMP-binding protein
MNFGKIKAGEYLFKTGDLAHCFYIVEEGVLEVLVDNRVKQELKKNDGFGELALL